MSVNIPRSIDLKELLVITTHQKGFETYLNKVLGNVNKNTNNLANAYVTK